MKKSPSLEKWMNRYSRRVKEPANTDSSVDGKSTRAHIEQLEDRLLYSADPFSVLLDPPETTAEFPVGDALLPDNTLTIVPVNASVAEVYNASTGNDSFETKEPSALGTLNHDEIAGYLESADLNLFSQDAIVESDSVDDGDSTILSEAIDDKKAGEFSGRRTIMVGGVNDAPTMSGFPSTVAQFTEAGAGVLVGPSLLVNDPDLDLSDYNGFAITLHRSGGANASDQFDLGSYASGANLVHVDGGGAIIGTIVQNSAGLLQVQFNAAATTDAVTDTVRAIAYSHSTVISSASQVDLLWTLDDNNTGAQGSGGALIANYVSSIDIVPGQFIAVDDELGDVISGTPYSILPSTLLANETGTNANSTTILGITNPTQGGLTDNGTSLDYSSTSGDSGAVSFDYTAMAGDPELISQWQLSSDASDDTGLNSGVLFSDSAANNLVFDGDDYVELPVIDYPTEFTLSFDFKVNRLDNNSEESFISVGDWDTQNSLFIWIAGDEYTEIPSLAGKIITSIWDSNDATGGFQGYTTDAAQYRDGDWHNYAVAVREGTGPANSGVFIYIDGVQQDTSSNNVGSDAFEPTGPTYLGVDNNSVDGLEYYLDIHEMANVQLINGYNATQLEVDSLNELNEFSTATASLNLRNEETLINNKLLVVDEDLTEPLSDTELLTMDDEDGPSSLTYTIIDAADFGFLMLDGFDLDVNDSFTQEAVNNGRVDYRHGGSETATADSTVLRVDDGKGSFTDLTFQIELTPVNDPPLPGSIESSSLLYSEGDGDIAVSNTVTVTDVDSINMNSAVVAISAGHNSSEDTLIFSDTANITGFYNSSAGTLTMTGTAAKADWQAALRSVSYRNTSDQPDLTDRTVSFVINDGDDDSSAAMRSIELSAVNDSPLLNDGVLANIVKNRTSPPGETVANIFSGQFSDVDGTFAGIVIINDASTTEGSWQYSTDAGVDWYDIQPLGASTGLALDINALLRFLPATDYTGAVPQLRIPGIDDSYTGLFTDGPSRAVIDVSSSTAGDPLSSTSATIFSHILPAGPTDLSSGIDLNVDGGNDSYLLADDGGVLFGGLTQFTVESQFSIDTVNDLNILVSYAVPGTSNEFFYGVLSDGTIQAYVNNTQVESTLLYPELLDGNRHSLAVSWNSNNGDIHFYVDGDLAHSATGIDAGYVMESGGSLVFAQEQDTVNGGFIPEQVLQGTIYDVRLWNDARTAGELAQSYQSKIDTDSLPPSLIANWQMDGFNGSGAVVDVVSGNNLSVAHASGAGFIASSPASEFRIFEHAAVNTVVGTLVSSVINTNEDLIGDGTFNFSGATSYIHYGLGTTIGGAGGEWQVVSGNVDLLAGWEDTPLGGSGVDLNGTIPGSISQSITTEPGKTYQLTFALTGDFFATTQTTKHLRVSAGATSSDFSIDLVDGWSKTNLLWAERSMNFVATSTSTILQFSSLSAGNRGAMIGDVQVVELPSAVAALLATDPSLSYNGATNKFYLPVSTGSTWVAADAGARSELLNQVPGQLVTIDSAYENDVVQQLSNVIGANLWLGASDQTTEGDWRWQDGGSDGKQFWVGDKNGAAVAGVYTNWDRPWEPNNLGLEDHAILFKADGKWNDARLIVDHSYVVEWDADTVLSQMKFTLQSDPSGAFAIDSDTGKVTVANVGVLDRESATFHDIIVRVTDAGGIAYDETFRIEIDDVPAPQISNIELNTLDYLENAGKVAITNTLAISTDPLYPTDTATISFASGYLAGQDRLAFTDYAGFTGAWDNTTGNLTITGSDTDTNWQDALRSVTYENTSDNPIVGDRSIVFSASYLTEESNSSTRLISVLTVNDPPMTADSIITVTEDAPYTLLTTDFAFSDTVDNNTFSAIQIVVAPVQGELLLNGSIVVDNQVIPVGEAVAGNLVFHPESNASGNNYDVATYRVQDDGGTSDGGDNLSDTIGVLTFDVTEVPDFPVLVTNGISLLRGGSFTFNSSYIEAIDGDVPAEQRVITLSADPSFGVIQVQGTAISASGTMTYADILAGDVSYVHNGVGTSNDTIMLSLADAGTGASGSVAATAPVNVNETHPQSVDDIASVNEGAEVDIAVMTNDVIADEPLVASTVTLVDGPLHGNLIIDSAGSIKYTHNGEESTSDSFTYTVADTGGDVSDPATVTITINGINDAPELTGFSGPASLTNEDSQLELTASVLASQINHNDAEDGSLTTFRVTSVLSGTLAIGPDASSAMPYLSGSNDLIQMTGSTTLNAYWTPMLNANGSLPAFTVRGVDSAGVSSMEEADIQVEVVPVNDLPVLSGYESLLVSGTEDTELPIAIADLQASSSDLEDGSVAAMQVQAVISGSLFIGADSASATPYTAVTNDTIDTTNIAYWVPGSNSNGTINAFSIRGVDSDGGLSPTIEIVIVSVNPVNDAPALAGYNDAIAGTTEDNSVTLLLSDLQAASTDVEDGALQALVVQSVASGALAIGADQASATPFVIGSNDSIDTFNNAYWTPDLNATGNRDAFSVRAVDSVGELSVGTATIIVAVSPENDPPVLSGYSSAIVTGTEDASQEITLADLQASSSDVEDGLLNAMEVQSVASGTLFIGADQASAMSFVIGSNNTIDAANNAYWIPGADENGIKDAFVVRGVDSDGLLSVDSATITASVSAVNDAPFLAGYGIAVASTSEDTTVPLSLSDLQASSGDVEDGLLQGIVVQGVTSGILNIGVDQATAVPFSAGANDRIDSVNNAYWTPDTDENGIIGAFSIRGIDSESELSAGSGAVFIDVSAVNDSPVLSGYNSAVVSTDEDTTVALTIADLQGTSSDVEDGPLQGIVVQSVASGTLLIGADLLSASVFETGVNDTINSSNNAYWTPDPDVNGNTDAFTMHGIDSEGLLSIDSAMLRASVSAVNDVPYLAGYGGAVASTSEDTTVPLSLSDLQASSGDVEDGVLQGMVVQNVASGTLTIGVDQASASAFSAGNNDTIDANNIAFWTPDEHAYGTMLGAFKVHAEDGNGAASLTSELIIVDVRSANDAPLAVGNTIELPSESFYRFNLTDFGFSDPVEGDQLSAVQITVLPDSGQLIYQGTLVTPDQEIAANGIALGQLQYKPETNIADDFITTQIMFTVRDDGGTEEGGIDLSVDPAVLTLIIENQDEPPVIDFGSLQVVENSVAGTVIGQLNATDPDPVTTHINDGGFAAADRSHFDRNSYAADGSLLGSDLGGWQVVSGEVDLRGDAWTKGPDAGNLVDLNGTMPGAIEQVIETTPGARYSLTFAFGGNFRNTSVSGSVFDFEVSAADQRAVFSTEAHPGWSWQNLAFQSQTVTFTALDTSTTIGFQSLTPGGYGAIITDIVVQDELKFDLVNTDVPFSISDGGTIVVTDNMLDHETLGAYELDVRVTEPDGRTVVASVPIGVTDINESPELLLNQTLTATINTAQIIDSTLLAAVDEDEADLPPDTLNYTLLIPPGSGVLQLNGVDLELSDSFTQQDINQQRLAYSGSVAGADSFTFRLADGGEDGVTHTDGEFLIESYEPLLLEAASNWGIVENGQIEIGVSHLDVSGGYTGADQLLIDVVLQPASSEFINKQTGLASAQFTMQQLYDGDIVLTHDGSEPLSELIHIELYRTDSSQPLLVGIDTILLDVTDVADAPMASDSVMATDHATALIISASQLGFDDNDDGDDLHAIAIVSTPATGALLLAGNPVQPGTLIDAISLNNNELRFQPDPLTSGTVIATIEFKVVDSGDLVNGGSNESEQVNTISITVISDHSPQATADNIVVDEGGVALSVTTGESSVTGNDTDLDTPKAELLVQIVDPPLHGTLQLNPDGSFVYRHDGSETISDSFRYRVVDADSALVQGNGSIAQVDIEIVPRNDNPEAGQAENQWLVTDEPFQIRLPDDLFTDVDPDDELTLLATLSDGSELPGWISFDSMAGVFSGTPDSQSPGNVVVIVTATDSGGATAKTSFQISIEPEVAALSMLEDLEEVFGQDPVSPVAAVTRAILEVKDTVDAEPSFTRFVSEPDRQQPASELEEDQEFIESADDGYEPVTGDFDDKIVKHNSTESRQADVFEGTSAEISAETIDLNTLFFAGDDYSTERSKRIADVLDRNRDSLDALVEQKVLVVSGTVTITAGVSIGYLVLLARGGLLLGSVMSSMPAWRFLDPVPVLQNFSEDEDEDAESLQTLVYNEDAQDDKRLPQSESTPEPESARPGSKKGEHSNGRGEIPPDL